MAVASGTGFMKWFYRIKASICNYFDWQDMSVDIEDLDNGDWILIDQWSGQGGYEYTVYWHDRFMVHKGIFTNWRYVFINESSD